MSTMTFKPADWSKQIDMLRKLPDVIGDKVIVESLTDANQIGVYPAYQAAKKPSRGSAPSYRKPNYSKRLTGDLAMSVDVKVKHYKGRAYVWGAVGPTMPKGAHGSIVEQGHRAAVGGTLKPLNEKRLAPISKRGRYYTLEVYKASNSRGRRKRKALMRYLTRKGKSVDDLMADAQEWAKTKYDETLSSDFMRGALKTGGLYRKAHGLRGTGRVAGRVPGYPFLAPTFNAQKSAIARAFEQYVEINSERELSKLAATK